MKKMLLLAGLILIVGCMAVRTYEVEKPRIDTSIEGNQGVIFGTAKVEPKESNLGPTRKISVIEIEFASPKKVPAESGEVFRQDIPIEEDMALSEVRQPEELDLSSAQPVESYTLYTVKKNDTLQKISHKFYGTTRKWKFIYDNNKDTLRSPDKLYPGLELKIPTLN